MITLRINLPKLHDTCFNTLKRQKDLLIEKDCDCDITSLRHTEKVQISDHLKFSLV